MSDYADNYNLTLALPPDLRRRLRRISKQVRRTMSDIVRVGTRNEVEKIEAKLAEDLAKEKEQMEAGRRSRPLGRLPTLPPSTVAAPGPTPSRTRIAAVVDDYAQKIALADDESETPRLVKAAFEKAKRECPLTYPTEEALVHLLEDRITQLRDQGPTEARDLTTLTSK